MPLWKSRTYENVWKSEYFVNKKLSLLVEANLFLNSWQNACCFPLFCPSLSQEGVAGEAPLPSLTPWLCRVCPGQGQWQGGKGRWGPACPLLADPCALV